MEETSSLGLGSELSAIESVGSLLGSSEGLVSELIDQVDAAEENLNRALLSVKVAVDTTRVVQESQLGSEIYDSDLDTMPGSQDVGVNPPTTTTPDPSDPVEFVDWQDDDDKVLAPQAGGQMRVEGEPMAYTGSDSDSKVIIYSYVVDKTDKSKGSWKCPKEPHKATWKSHKGPLHVGQFRPTNVKEKRKVKTSCCTFVGPSKYGGANFKIITTRTFLLGTTLGRQGST